jgi:hypothetical protein
LNGTGQPSPIDGVGGDFWLNTTTNVLYGPSIDLGGGNMGWFGSGGILLEGTTGATGSQGFQGFQGLVGPTGAAGEAAEKGETGSQGFQGFQGNQGLQGITGPTGVQGFQGFQGNQGPQGITGPTGVQGFQGFQGNQGRQGITGPTGVQGFQGFQGNQGRQGITGPTGVQGFQGFQGNQGLQGITGPTGVQGFQGFQGNQGLQGITGPTGPQGFQGFQGPTGGAEPVGNNNEIQYRYDNSLSASSLSTIITNTSLVPSSGYSGNFVHYTESITSHFYPSAITGTDNELTIPFGTCNTFTVDNIRLNDSQTLLTITGFGQMTTGQSMTLILGHTGVNGSRIEIPQGNGIWWSGGVIGGIGSTSTIYPSSTKRYDVITFFDDGYRIFGSYSLNYTQ